MKEVTASITGIVLEIHVSVGDEVDEGDEVMTLESMKMEMPVESEVSGVVSKIKVSEGDQVIEDDVVMILE